MTYRVMRAVLVLIFLTSSFPKALGPSIVLGVLEDHGGHYAGDGRSVLSSRKKVMSGSLLPTTAGIELV
jgi:hypothetical protein